MSLALVFTSTQNTPALAGSDSMIQSNNTQTTTSSTTRTTNATTAARDAARERSATTQSAMSTGGSAEGQASYGAGYADQMIVERGANTQTGNQSGNSDNGSDGKGKSKGLAGDLFSIGMGLIAAGVAVTAACMCPAGVPLIAMGAFFNQGGEGASGAGDQMGNMSSSSNYLKDRLGSNIDPTKSGTTDQGRNSTPTGKGGEISLDGRSPSSGSGGGVDVGGGVNVDAVAGGFTVDESALRAGKLGEAFDKLEKNYGIDRADFARAMMNGEDMGAYLEKHGATGGKSAGEFNAMVAGHAIDPDEARKKFEDGEFDEYKGAVEFAGGGDAIDNVAGADKKDASGASKAGDKSYDQLMAEIFGKKPGAGDVDKILSEELKKDAELRALASNGKYQLSNDYIKDNLYREKSLFERVNRVYKEKSGGMIPEDYFIRLQAERDMNRFR